MYLQNYHVFEDFMKNLDRLNNVYLGNYEFVPLTKDASVIFFRAQFRMDGDDGDGSLWLPKTSGKTCVVDVPANHGTLLENDDSRTIIASTIEMHLCSTDGEA